MTESKPTYRLKELMTQRVALLTQQEHNYRSMGELEKKICDMQGEVNHIARDIQVIGMQLAKTKQCIAEERDGLFHERFMDKVRETLPKETYLKLVEEVNNVIAA